MSLAACFPVAAVVTTAAFEEHSIAARLANMSGHSFDPFGATVAATVLGVIAEQNLIECAADSGAYLKAELERVAASHASLGPVRGRGVGDHDFVRMQVPPWQLPLTELRWGRGAHRAAQL